MTASHRLAAAAIALAATGCAPGPGALSTALAPKQSPAYYVAQGLKYFDTYDTSADRASVPVYAELVARWEWPPWLKLTGYGRDMLHDIDPQALKAAPSTVPVRDCRAFAVQPFARCHVSFQYAEGACPIYEEFTFNDQGEVTFIEAWSDRADAGPTRDAADRWAEGAGVHRLSTRIPGLGTPTGRIDPAAPWMKDAAARDPEVADFVARTEDFWRLWLEEYVAAGKTLFQRGCGF